MSNNDPYLIKEFDRLVDEGNTTSLALDHSYDCNKGFHVWKWYVGFHIERFWYCEHCTAKDLKKPAPPKS